MAYYTRSTDNGVNWETETCISQLAGVYFPTVTASGSNVHAVWYRILTISNIEIYYNHSVNAGVNWGDDVRLTNNDGYALQPSIAASDTMVHVVWADQRDGNYEIYYKRNPTGNPAVEETFTNTKQKLIEKYNVFPNPFVSSARVVGHDTEDFMMYDVSGKCMGMYKGNHIGIDLPPGVYFIKSVSKNSFFTQTIKVQ
jgi:hypothetical protein